MLRPFRLLRVLLSLVILGVGAYFYLRKPDHVYAMPMREAHRMLETIGLPPVVMGTPGPEYDIKTADPARVVWAVKRGNVAAFNFIAELSPVSEAATRVEIKIAAAGTGPAAEYMERRLNEHFTIKQLYLIAMDEYVAATLERRDFDVSKIAASTVIAAVANTGEMMRNLQKGIEADQKRIKANIAKAYADEAAGLR